MTDAAAARPALPERVRWRVLALTADALGDMAADEVPGPLRAVARFRPDRRAKLGAGPLSAALATDDAFRRRVAARVRTASPDLCHALDDGAPPPAGDPVDVAAHAYLLDVDAWPALAAAAGEAEAARAESDAVGRLTAERDRLAADLATERAAVARLRDEAARGVDVDEAALTDLRRALRVAQTAARDAAAAADAARTEADSLRAAAHEATTAWAQEADQWRERLAAAEADRDAARRALRAGRDLLDARTRLLLDTLLGAVRGLEQELLPGATDIRPADTVGGREPGSAAPAVGDSWGRADDPAHLERLLALPRPHLVVDGYNVTKTGYPGLALADQRDRLLGALAGVAARTRAEITAVFDGAALDSVPAVGAARGVRVRFSEPGQTADALIGRLVRAEPAGRVVVVVSTDREVTEAARRAGAHHADATALLALLGR